MRRTVAWGGLHNARDLGGLPVGDSVTRFGRFYRAPRLDDLGVDGWVDVVRAGVVTIVDLRNAGERRVLNVPGTIATHHRPIEDPGDAGFMSEWGSQLNSPIYYSDNLDRWPHKIAGVFRVFALAPGGGIIFHCAAGRDRTGLISALLLQLAGVADRAILDDYELGVRAMNEHFASIPSPRERARSGGELEGWIGETRDRLAGFLSVTDVAAYLAANGITDMELHAIRARLLH